MTITRIKSIISVACQSASSLFELGVFAQPLNNTRQNGTKTRPNLALRGRFARNALVGLLGSIVLSSCGLVDYRRVAYDFLRQEDCRRNDVDVYEFCGRTFVFEYDEYEQLRQEYIRSEQDKILRDQVARERYTNIYDGV